ncbi:MAG: hypothetical protein HKP58_15600, partial [Desulfatitalea sp.]|nr:hypothetical protein [Desulfatitalea sp.]
FDHADRVIVSGQNLIAISPRQGAAGYQLVQTAHPCPACGENTAPRAAFSHFPGDGDTSDTYVFDASASSDAQDASALSYRWDINGDGVWDTHFSADSVFSHDFDLPGTQFVRLQVKDSGGLTHSISQRITIRQRVDTGTSVRDSTAFLLQFNVTAEKVDRRRSKAYITDKDARRLYVVDLVTGFTEKYFEFDAMPERMAISPDDGQLYVGLRAQAHRDDWWKEDQNGYIAVIDLQRQAHVNTMQIAADPYDLVVTSTGKLIVSSGSGQSTDICAYDARTGDPLGRAGIRKWSRLALHPSENWVFAADAVLSDIQRFDISGAGIVADIDSPYHGAYRIGANVWATPDGNYLITRSGDVFSAPEMAFVANLTSLGVAINDLSINETNQTIIVAGSDASVYEYDLYTWEPIAVVDSIYNPQFILEDSEAILVISVDEPMSSLEELVFHNP